MDDLTYKPPSTRYPSY